MVRRCAPGFTLIEITIGFALFLILMVFFLTILRGGSRESTLSSDHFTSAMLSQKVIEDVLEEVELNPLGFESLGIDESTPQTSVAVVDGSSPFFNAVEDRQAPWGKISGQEGTIDAGYQPLFNQVQAFNVSAIGKRVPLQSSAPENKHLVETSVTFDWKAKVGKGNTVSQCRLFAPIGLKPASITFAFDQAQLEEEIAHTFFNEPGDSLAKLAGDTNANFQTVLSLGILHFGTKGFLDSNSFKTYRDQVTEAKTKAEMSYPNKAAEAQARQNLAKAYFDVGNITFQMTYILASEVLYLQNNCEATHLGDQLRDDPEVFSPGLENYRKLIGTFKDAIEKSRYQYSLLMSPDLAQARGVKNQMFVIRRLLDLHRILAAISATPRWLTEYQAFLTELAKAFEGRNPYLHRLILQERQFATSSDQLAEKHPFLQAVRMVTEEAGPIAQELLTKYPLPEEPQ